MALDAPTLARAFDRTFAEPQQNGAAPTDDFLDVRIGTDPYAIRLSDVAGLFADKVITRVPTPLPALAGTAGFRGAIRPVYDLAVLMGYAPTGSSRWLVVTAVEPVALLLSGFEGHLRLPRDVRDVVQTPRGVYPILHVPSVLDTIKRQLSQHTGQKER